jgi:hypothetical protein
VGEETEEAGEMGGVRTELDYRGRIFCFTDAKRRAKRGFGRYWSERRFWGEGGVCVEG